MFPPTWLANVALLVCGLAVFYCGYVIGQEVERTKILRKLVRELEDKYQSDERSSLKEF